jgi:hypothetical protein
MPRLFEELELAHGDGRFPRLFRSIIKAQLILDDWGPDRLTATQRRDLMEIVEERSGRGSIMITSQLPITAWHDVIGEPTFADAILDRIVHNAYRLELEGASKCNTIAKMNDECLKPDTQNTQPHGNGSLVGGYHGTSGHMLRNTQGNPDRQFHGESR